MVGRGGGDRKDKLLNKACALNALQPLPLSNWNKRNRHQDESALGARTSITALQTFFFITSMDSLVPSIQQEREVLRATRAVDGIHRCSVPS